MALNADHHFIQAPRIPQAALLFFQFASIGQSKFSTPLAHRFIGDGNAVFSQQFFDFEEAQAEAMLEPHGVADDFGRKTMALVAELFGRHASPRSQM